MQEMVRHPGGRAQTVRDDLSGPFLDIRLLGGFRVAVNGVEIPESRWRLAKARALVKLLALEPTARLRRERLMDTLWPHLGPEAAANNLRRTLYAARQALSPQRDGFLRLESGFLTLFPTNQFVSDVEQFKAAASAARAATHDRDALCRALQCYTGDLLPEDLDEPWTAAPREDLRRTYVDLCLQLACGEEQAGALPAAINALRQAVAAAPCYEGAHRHLMCLYARTGQHHQALRQFQELEAALRNDMDAQPEAASIQLYQDILKGGLQDPGLPQATESLEAGPQADQPAPPSATAPVRRHNLPAPFTSFIGRQREMRQVRRLLDQGRLLNLVGPGGCGKTRLAIEVARTLVDQYPDGVWLVELADLVDPSLVPQSVASVLEVREGPIRSPLDSMARHLANRNLCLVLDNCEHLLSGCANLVHLLLQACPGLKVMATSRQALGIIGEAVYRVPALAYPDVKESTPPVDWIARTPAVELFVERARRGTPDFTLTPAKAGAVASICSRLDGMPLAIELAAARVKSLSPQEIAARLDDRFALLVGGSPTAPPRHHTLRAVTDWSYHLLSPGERLLLRRLSVFSGGWTLEMAQEVCSDPDGPPEGGVAGERVVDLLGSLVDKSWVLAEEGTGGTRYRLLETLREYASQRLQESAEVEALGRRHAWCFLALAGEAAPAFTTADMPGVLARLFAEEENLRAALAWTVEHGEAEVGVQLGAALSRYWYLRGQLREGEGWLQAVAALDPESRIPARAWVMFGAGSLALLRGDLDRAQAWLEAGYTLFHGLGDIHGMADILGVRSMTAQRRGDSAAAADFAGRALALYRQLGNPWGAAMSQGFLGAITAGLGEPERAQMLMKEGLEGLERAGDRMGIAIVLEEAARVAASRREAARAEELAAQSLIHYRDIGDPRGISACLELMAGAGALQGRLFRAARIAGAAEALREATASVLYPSDLVCHGPMLELLRSGLRREALARAWDQGRALDQPAAVAYALTQALTASEAAQRELEGAQAEGWSRLTQREREVALLMAHGLRNREVAQRLIISEATVRVHVRHVLRKLQLSSRARVAAWAALHGLPETGPEK